MANFLKGRGASDATVGSLSAVSENRVARTGITHLRMEQRIDGLLVYNTYVKAAITDRGELAHLIEKIAPVPAAALDSHHCVRASGVVRSHGESASR